MVKNPYLIQDSEGNSIEVTIQTDHRLKKSARWTRSDGSGILLRIPYRMPRQNIDKLLGDIGKQLIRQQRRTTRRTDADLDERARVINRRFFNSELTWSSIRWVGNMHSRLGSCTNNGPTDGHIRISQRIHDWPQWVVDYVIAHELAHRRYDHHGPDFWGYLRSCYPHTERALGFIQGIGFARNEPINEGQEVDE